MVGLSRVYHKPVVHRREEKDIYFRFWTKFSEKLPVLYPFANLHVNSSFIVSILPSLFVTSKLKLSLEVSLPSNKPRDSFRIKA
ncbi:hypothetical protein CEXT_498811 [Caerostris extrusa]|uniref:Uncharacterized protein n=1 Tax=Caerostris extrusa TaxID=172846 RepID=A0AAV4Y9U3_CAEEX|nr:hypothetical protein CEXT_498811 [Caerostris extrusa]